VRPSPIPIITPAMKHVNKFCEMLVFPQNAGDYLIYLVAGIIMMVRGG